MPGALAIAAALCARSSTDGNPEDHRPLSARGMGSGRDRAGPAAAHRPDPERSPGDHTAHGRHRRAPFPQARPSTAARPTMSWAVGESFLVEPGGDPAHLIGGVQRACELASKEFKAAPAEGPQEARSGLGFCFGEDRRSGPGVPCSRGRVGCNPAPTGLAGVRRSSTSGCLSLVHGNG